MKEIMNELSQIKSLLQYSDSHTTKVQAIGKDKNGNLRYMIYITKLAKNLELQKGDRVSVTLKKLSHEDQVSNNKNAGDKLKAQHIERAKQKTQDVVYEKKQGITTIKLENGNKIISPKAKEPLKGGPNLALADLENYKGAEEFDENDKPLDVSKDIAEGKPEVAAEKINQRIREEVDPEFEEWKKKYKEYKEANDSRLEPHIMIGKTAFKERIEAFMEGEKWSSKNNFQVL